MQMHKSTTKKNIELADILQANIHKIQFITSYEKKVLNAIINCRTSKLGRHKLFCDNCGYTEISYNSCRNRHCPKCQGSNGFKWVDKKMKDILPVEYYHAVFTVPDTLNKIILYNKKIAYKLLFKAVSKTLLEVAGNKKNLGAKIGFISVMHTWDQLLNFHPHIHCIVTGGGLSMDKSKWISSKKKYLLPVKILSKVFRGKFLSFLEKYYKKGKLKFTGKIKQFNDPVIFKNILKTSASKDWVVYCKKPFAGPDQVFNYLARYTHRVGISNSRIVSMKDGNVTFIYKDRQNNKKKTATISALTFVKRFLLHILPSGFVKIRHYGFLANCIRQKMILKIKELLKDCVLIEDLNQSIMYQTRIDKFLCPKCRKGELQLLRLINTG